MATPNAPGPRSDKPIQQLVPVITQAVAQLLLSSLKAEIRRLIPEVVKETIQHSHHSDAAHTDVETGQGSDQVGAPAPRNTITATMQDVRLSDSDKEIIRKVALRETLRFNNGDVGATVGFKSDGTYTSRQETGRDERFGIDRIAQELIPAEAVVSAKESAEGPKSRSESATGE